MGASRPVRSRQVDRGRAALSKPRSSPATRGLRYATGIAKNCSALHTLPPPPPALFDLFGIGFVRFAVSLCRRYLSLFARMVVLVILYPAERRKMVAAIYHTTAYPSPFPALTIRWCRMRTPPLSPHENLASGAKTKRHAASKSWLRDGDKIF